MKFESYLEFLESLLEELKKLADLQQKKIDTIEKHNLEELDSCIKQEQAVSLVMRGLERKRTLLLAELGLQGTTMSQMVDKCPEEHKEKTEELVNSTLAVYANYNKLHEKAAKILKRNMEIVETSLASRGYTLGKDDEDDIIPQTPQKANTDFKA